MGPLTFIDGPVNWQLVIHTIIAHIMITTEIFMLFPFRIGSRCILIGNVEKSRQRRSRPFAVLTYYEYAPRVKMAAALLDRPFGKTQGMLF